MYPHKTPLSNNFLSQVRQPGHHSSEQSSDAFINTPSLTTPGATGFKQQHPPSNFLSGVNRPHMNDDVPSIEEMIDHLKQMVILNIRSLCFPDAVFFGEKQVLLCQHKVTVLQQSNNLDDQALSPPNSQHRIDFENMAAGNKMRFEKLYWENRFQQSVYDMAYCLYMEKEYMRCISLIEKH